MPYDVYIRNYYEKIVLNVLIQYNINKEMFMNYFNDFNYVKHFVVEKEGK